MNSDTRTRARAIFSRFEGSSRFMLLGMLAELNGVTRAFELEPMTDEQRRALARFSDDRELANTMLGERVVDAMFGDGPVRVTVSEGPASAATKNLGYCNPNDLDLLAQNIPEYSWLPDMHVPQGLGYNDQGKVVARFEQGGRPAIPNGHR